MFNSVKINFFITMCKNGGIVMTIKEDSSTHALLYSLVDLPLRYGIKSSDMELFDFGFGDYVESTDYKGAKREICAYTLHVLCGFKVIQRTGLQCVDWFDGNSTCNTFHSKVNELIKRKVKRVELSEKNDLWLDFGDFWIVFVTTEDGNESWRIFSSDIGGPHLIASDSWLRLDL